MQVSVLSSKSKQAGAGLTHSANRYHAQCVTAHDEATITYNNRSRRNYTRTELAIEHWALGSLTRRSKRARRLKATRKLGIESPEA